MGRAWAVIIAFVMGTVVGVGLAAASTHSVAQATPSGSSSPVAQATPSSSAGPAVQMTSSVTTMNVTEGDMYLKPATTTVGAGTITFSVTNEGAIHHEFVIVSGDPTGTVGDEKGTVSEDNHIGGPDGPEIGDLHPGQTKTMTATLQPGTYTAMCNYPGHYAAGMHFQFTVK